MLVLSRKSEESIVIGDQIEVKVIEVRGDTVRLGVSAPKNISIYRKEVHEAIQRENIAAAQSAGRDLSRLADALKKQKLKQKEPQERPEK